jgi:CHAT domain-containing protein
VNNLGVLYFRMGYYEKAEPFYLETRDIRAKILGVKSLDYAFTLNNLGILYRKLGDIPKGVSLALETTVILEQTLGKKHPDYLVSLNNLANAYVDAEQLSKAASIYLNVCAIQDTVIGKEHSNYAQSLNNLAICYQKMGRYKEAEPLFLQASAIREKALGEAHPDYAMSLINLGRIYTLMDSTDRSEDYFRKGIALQEKAIGKRSVDYSQSLYDLARLCELQMRFAESSAFLEEQFALDQERLLSAINFLSESELAHYTTTLQRNSNNMSSCLLSRHLSGQADAPLPALAFDRALFVKGFLLTSSARLSTLTASTPAINELNIQLKGYRRRLAAELTRPISQQKNVAELEEMAAGIEKEMARSVAGYTEAIRQVKWQEVQAALKRGEAGIEFVYFQVTFPKKTDSTLYAALVLLPGANEPQFIPLFGEKQLATLLKTEGKPQPAFYNELYANDNKGSQLYDLIWKPIAAVLPEGTTVYCSPSGLLHRLNLAAIPAPDGKTLAEKHHLTILGSTRQLVIPSALAANQNATAQLYGGIQYDASPVVVTLSNTTPDDLVARRGPDFSQNDSTLRGENWNYLRWTEVEISAAAETMKNQGIAPTLKKGAEATEESFKAIGTTAPSPRILHVATHGFFFPDPKTTSAGFETPPTLGIQAPPTFAGPAFKVSENPMIRSGLVLAGGNHAWKTGKPLRPDLEDGILTAYEISQMNLSNTELVVLSACETGLGDLVGNEGVYGLQRAFKIAGARYLIMSLWQVPDFQTQVFMGAFYKHWLNGKMSVPEAFRATQSELRAKYGEAFKWAGFVLVE